jgi:hypothetical protein
VLLRIGALESASHVQGRIWNRVVLRDLVHASEQRSAWRILAKETIRIVEFDRKK